VSNFLSIGWQILIGRPLYMAYSNKQIEQHSLFSISYFIDFFGCDEHIYYFVYETSLISVYYSDGILDIFFIDSLPNYIYKLFLH